MAPVAPTHFADIFDRVVEQRSDALCQIHGAHNVTWGETSRQAHGLGSALDGLGLKRGAKVAQYLFNCPEYLETVWGCFAYAYVPVNTNYRYKDAELIYLWTNADVEVVVFHGSFSDTIECIRGSVPLVRAWLWVDDGYGQCPRWARPFSEAVAVTPVPPPRRTGDEITLLYTGGTTGLPKGVVWRLADYTAVLAGRVDEGTGRPPGDTHPVHLPACPLMHGVGLHTALRAWTQGGSVVTMVGRRFDVVELLDTVEAQRVSSLAIVGDAFAKPIVGALDAEPHRWDISSLRQVTSSGVTLSAVAKEGLFHHHPHLVITDTLGSSEAMGIGSSSVTSGDHIGAARFVPLPNARVIRDDGNSVEPGSGELGLIAVRGNIPLGYYKDPEKSAATFREIAGERWSVPGDSATLSADGVIQLLGRGSLCINRGGEKIFPEEVEEALKGHRDVRDAVVVGLPDDRLGEEVYAVVELEPDRAFAPGDVADHVRSVLAGYKAPKCVFTVPSIERAPNGKADYDRWTNHARALVGNN